MRYLILLVGVGLSSVCLQGCSVSESKKQPLADWDDGDHDRDRDNRDHRDYDRDHHDDRDHRDW